MVCRSDRATHSKSLTQLSKRDDAAAAGEELEGEAVRKALFTDEAEVSRRREQRRRELVDQHENPRKPTPLLEVNVNIHPEKWLKSLHCLMNHSETVGEQWTVRFIPAGSKATSHQQGAWPNNRQRKGPFQNTSNRRPRKGTPATPSTPPALPAPPTLPPS